MEILDRLAPEIADRRGPTQVVHAILLDWQRASRRSPGRSDGKEVAEAL